MTIAHQVVARAEAEWDFFGRPERDLKGRHLRRGGIEHLQPYASRVGDYWATGAQRPDLDGTDREMPWSAAFISFVFRTAGAGRHFPRAAGHAQYIHAAKRQGVQGVLQAHAPNRYAPKVGDIITYARGDDPVDLDDLPAWFTSHGDIVVAVHDGYVEVIGGNVGNTVTRRPFSTTPTGRLNDKRVAWIAVIENRIPVPAAPTMAAMEVTARSGLRLRGGPGRDYDVVGGMPFGMRVFAGAAQGDWLPIDVEGDGAVDGFAHGAFLRAAV